jgi:hypothetical protein
LININFYKAKRFCVVPVSIASEEEKFSEAKLRVQKILSEIEHRLSAKFNKHVSFLPKSLSFSVTNEFDFSRGTRVAIASFRIFCPSEIRAKIESEVKKVAHRHGGEFKRSHDAI